MKVKLTLKQISLSLFCFLIVLTIADRIDDYLLRKDVRTYMFSEGGLELAGKYECEDVHFHHMITNEYLPAPAIICTSKMISDQKRSSNYNGREWNYTFRLTEEMYRHWLEYYNTRQGVWVPFEERDNPKWLRRECKNRIKNCY